MSDSKGNRGLYWRTVKVPRRLCNGWVEVLEHNVEEEAVEAVAVVAAVAAVVVGNGLLLNG
jgi:hypothetical protein